eukprot:jgi/Bigna1/83583/fgenesh1_pg.111_\
MVHSWTAVVAAMTAASTKQGEGGAGVLPPPFQNSRDSVHGCLRSEILPDWLLGEKGVNIAERRVRFLSEEEDLKSPSQATSSVNRATAHPITMAPKTNKGKEKGKRQRQDDNSIDRNRLITDERFKHVMKGQQNTSIYLAACIVGFFSFETIQFCRADVELMTGAQRSYVPKKAQEEEGGRGRHEDDNSRTIRILNPHRFQSMYTKRDFKMDGRDRYGRSKAQDNDDEESFEGDDELEETSSSDDDDEDLILGDDEDEEEVIEEEDQSSIPVGDSTSRIAVMHLDWDHIKSVDLLVLFQSFLPPGHLIKAVTTYVSQFGKERMKTEAKYGPVSLWSQKGGKAKKKKEEDGEDEEEQPISEVSLRRYEKERLKYFYAVVECDDVAAARHVYRECDGVDIGGSGNQLDLRYIPVGMSFDKGDIRDRAIEVPHDYNAPEFFTRALSHSKEKKMNEGETAWERRMRERKQRKEQRKKAAAAREGTGGKGGYDDDGYDDDEEAIQEHLQGDPFFAGFLSESKNKARKTKRRDAEEEGEEEATAAAAVGGGGEDTDDKIRATEMQRERQRAAMELLTMDEDDDEAKGYSLRELERAFEEEQQKGGGGGKKQKKKKKKKKKKGNKSEGDGDGGDDSYGGDDAAALMRSRKDEFEMDVQDPRFKNLYNNPLFAIDPTSPHFKKTKGTQQLIEERRKRFIQKSTQDTAQANKAAKQSESSKDNAEKTVTKKNKKKSLRDPALLSIIGRVKASAARARKKEEIRETKNNNKKKMKKKKTKDGVGASNSGSSSHHDPDGEAQQLANSSAKKMKGKTAASKNKKKKKKKKKKKSLNE